MRHGPHHVAQKSTTVSLSFCSTCCSKSASVTATAFDIARSLRACPAPPRELEFSAGAPSHQRTHMTDVPRRAPRIAHIGIAVRALDDILPFYRDLLGLPEVDLDDADGARIAGFAAGESLVELLEADTPESP